MVTRVPSSLNALIASQSPIGRQSLAQADALRAIQSESNAIQLKAQSLAIKAGPGATLTTQYDYDVGPDGQLYVKGVTVTTSRRAEGVVSGITADAREQSARNQRRAPQQDAQGTLQSLSNPKPELSPTEELALFSSDDFRQAAFNSVENTNLDKLQLSDVGVRTHEALHFRTGAGLTTQPEFTLQEGPDGQFYAIGGDVGIQTSNTSDPEKAARTAQTVANAALASNDVSAQDVAVARSALVNAAQFNSLQRQQERVAQLYQRNNDIVFNNDPLISAAA